MGGRGGGLKQYPFRLSRGGGGLGGGIPLPAVPSPTVHVLLSPSWWEGGDWLVKEVLFTRVKIIILAMVSFCCEFS